MPLLLKNLIDSLLDKQSDWRYTILRNWEKIMGPMYTKVCIEKIGDDTIFLGVYDSAWMNELHLLSQLIIKNINNSLQKPYIKSLRLRLTSRKPVTKIPKQVISMPPKPLMLSEVQKKALNTVKDPQLQEILKQLLMHCTPL